MMQTATRLLRLVDLAAGAVVSACMAVMVMVISAQVFMRYVLNSSFDWADEIARLTFVSAVFLAIPLGIREGAHVGITIIVQYLPPKMQDLLRRVLCLVAAMMLVVVFTRRSPSPRSPGQSGWACCELRPRCFSCRSSSACCTARFTLLSWPSVQPRLCGQTFRKGPKHESDRHRIVPRAGASGHAAGLLTGGRGARGLWLSGFDLSILPPRLLNSVNSFPLMSIPLFMVAGN